MAALLAGMRLHFLLGLLLASVGCLALGGPLPPFNLMCQNNLVGLSGRQMDELSKQYLFGTQSPSPLFSWTVKHTGIDKLYT